MGDDDRYSDDRCLSGFGSIWKNTADGSRSIRAQKRFDCEHNCDLFIVPYPDTHGSNSSLTPSTDGVVFVGDDSRLELFPTDTFGRAVPMRCQSRCALLRGFDFCCKCSVDAMYAVILAVVCILIIVVLIVDK
nr:protein m41 [Mastomys natalensis cytomegalovirus 3]WEG70294.1 protein m41 [Mastomys natalensis cytomegalovirus 3]WEG70434.1 protein m41 [Mastomys natalensis cytomegalovirus 3]WEG70574.1 protein m41 [Mastomys natalensis cytomegalovirus 3]WEG70854.1 protein m41 [Mastomys natalensis cytomegalovirus 3]